MSFPRKPRDVIPAKAGIQSFYIVLDSRFHGSDGQKIGIDEFKPFTRVLLMDSDDLARVYDILYIASGSLAETRSLGEKIGRNLSLKLVIGLSGELGSGKTSFVQGLARGLDIPDNYYITSPTYSLIHEYPGRIPLFHIDLYRIRRRDEIEGTGLYEILDRFGIFAIEWPDFVINDLDADFLSIHFEITDDDARKITMKAHDERSADLIKKL